ncbi:MAG: hypothetical protein ACPLRA_03530 [Candidatus Saccharicenans sp.]
MFDWLFAFFHLILFLGLLSYSIYNLITRNWLTGLILLIFLVAYYFFVLHRAVLKEIRRKKKRMVKK